MSMQPTATRYFLGANSQFGFYSLYDQFAAAPQDTLHIIKGGPGTGKSTFMKRIGKAAEEHGFNVEYILCSGDPNSLDGVYIPALHQGWADGTAPHVLEPKYFGISGTYINLGQFCHTEKLIPCADSIPQITTAYRQCYQKAYAYLGAAGKLLETKTIDDTDIPPRIRKRARAKIKKELSYASEDSAPPIKRFLRAISCQGSHFLSDTLNSFCDRLYVLESDYNLDSIFFEEILKEANRRKIHYILCPSPLNPQQTESVLFPSLRLCFSASKPEFSGKVWTIHLDSYLNVIDKAELKKREKLLHPLMDTAVFHLSQAKQLHDQLESCYRPALDTEALNRYTDQVLDRLFH